MGGPTGWPVAGFHSGTVPSPLPVASSLPSWLKTTTSDGGPDPEMGPTWMSGPTGQPVAGFHSRTVPSSPVLASSLASGLKAVPYAPPAAPSLTSTPANWAVTGSHTRAVLLPVVSLVLPTSRLPPVLNASSVTPPLEAEAAWMGASAGWPVTGLHSRTVPFSSALASSPSGLNASPATPSTPP